MLMGQPQQAVGISAVALAGGIGGMGDMVAIGGMGGTDSMNGMGGTDGIRGMVTYWYVSVCSHCVCTLPVIGLALQLF